MRLVCSTVFVLLGGLNMLGCQSGQIDARTVARLGPARDVVAASLEAMGGLAAMRAARPIRAKAIVTVAANGTDAYVGLQDQVIDPVAGTLEFRADVPQGVWKGRAAVGGEGSGSIVSADEELSSRLADSLVTLIGAIRGPLNLLDPQTKVTDAAEVRVAGQDLIRVDVTGDRTGAQAYYFDATTSILRYIAVGPMEGDGLKVAVLRYRMHPNGLAFVDGLRVMRRGTYALVGTGLLMEAEYKEVVFP